VSVYGTVSYVLLLSDFSWKLSINNFVTIPRDPASHLSLT
jgi:hypothetical protein